MIINKIKKLARKSIKKIVLPETDDLRVLKAAEKITREGFAKIILIGDEKVNVMAKKNNINLDNIEIINPKESSFTKKLIEEFYNLRKHKGMTKEKAKEIITENYIYFGNMLVYSGYADGLVSGAKVTTSDTLRPALQIIKTKKDIKTASCFFLMELDDKSLGENGCFIYADCGMNQNPSSEELVEIAKTSNDTFKLLLNSTPKIAFLSHSTNSSSICKDQEKVAIAANTFKEKYPDILSDGEMQFDTAIIPEIAKAKMPNSKIAGHANTLIFPDLDAGNIGYKIAERLAHAKAYGPITQGLNKPVNDLSRGCNVDDIIGVVAITSLQVEE